MPGYPSAPTTLNITDKLAVIAPGKGNIAGYYVWLVDPDAAQSAGDPHGIPGAGIYGPSSVTDSQGNWTINNVPGNSNYITFYGARSDRWEFPGISPYVALNPTSALASAVALPSGGSSLSGGALTGQLEDSGGFHFNATSSLNASGAVDMTGGSDASTAIAGVMTTGGTGTEAYPKGTALFSARLRFPSGSTLLGAGRGATTFKQANATNLGFVIDQAAGASHVHYQDFTIDGNKANNLTGTGALMGLFSGATSVMNVRALNAQAGGFNIVNAASDGSSLAFSHAENPAGPGIIIGANAIRSRVIGNRVNLPGSYGIFFSGANASFHTLVGNVINGDNSMTNIGIALGSSTSFVVAAANIVTKTDTTQHCLDSGSVSDSVVIGNVLSGGGNSMSSGGFQRLATIANIGRGNTSHGLSIYNTLTFTPTFGMDEVAALNIFSNSGTQGIDVDGASHILISGNIIKNSGLVTPNAAIGLHKSNLVYAARLLIIGNIGYDDQLIKTQTYGVDLVAQSRGVAILHNDFRGNRDGAINDLAADTYAHGNLGYNPRGSLTPPAVPASTVLLLNPFNVDCTVHIAGGTLTAIGIGGLPTPAAPALSQTSTGGTLAAATYAYRIAALNSAGHTIESVETTIVVAAGTTNTVKLTLPAVAGAWGFTIYGRTSGAELLMATNVQSPEWVDDGSITPSGAMPGTDTTGNTATGITAAAAAGSVHTVRVPWGSSIKLTYTVAPTWTWFGD